MATAANKKADAKPRNITISNRKAYHEYEIFETYVAGIVLTGTEIKSIRAGQGNLQDSFCRSQNGEIVVYNFYVAPYEQGNRYNVDPRRPRKLLLHKWEITKIVTRVNERGLTIIPTKLFFNHGFAKLEIGIGRGKKLWDKRESIASKDRDRDARRELASRE
jgi:SsrA-binding protein